MSTSPLDPIEVLAQAAVDRFKIELKERIFKELEPMIDEVVNDVGKRLAVQGQRYFDNFSGELLFRYIKQEK